MLQRSATAKFLTADTLGADARIAAQLLLVLVLIIVTTGARVEFA